ncbi:MAG: histidine kinase [Phycisphaera sp. RhM]|nr:histidine kinase [Phycisphaera sp. RhM]
MFASRVRAAAEAEGLEFQLAASLPDRGDIRYVIVDLATRSGAVEGLMERCGQVCPDAKVLAYGPHVQVARLDKAKQAGIPVVVTRGQFDRSLGTLFGNVEN